MGRFRVAVGVLVTSSLVSGCWLQPGFEAGHTNWNPGENELTSTTVVDLAELWSTDVAPGVNAPIAVGGTLYVSTSSGSAASLAAVTGAVRWQRDDLTFGPGDPAYFDGEVLVPTSDVSYALPMYVLSPSNGETVAMSQGGAVAVADDTLAKLVVSIGSLAGALWNVEWKYSPLVLDIGFGNPPAMGFAIVGDHVEWSRGTSAWGFSPACPPYPPPVPPTFRCAPDWITELGGNPTLPVAVGNDGVVYGDDSGTITVLDVATGAVRWRAEMGAPVTVAPAVADDTILVATSDGRLVALPMGGCGAATCDPLWQAHLGAAPSQTPVAGGDVVYVGTSSGDIVALAVQGCGDPWCAPLRTVTTGSAIAGRPIVHDGRVIAGTADGRVIAFGLHD